MTGESHPREETQAEREAAHKTLTKAARRLLLRHGRHIEIAPGVTEIYVGLFHVPTGTRMVLAQPYNEPSAFCLDLQNETGADPDSGRHTSYSSQNDGPVQRADFTRETYEQEKAREYNDKDLLRREREKTAQINEERRDGINMHPITAEETREVARMMTESIVTISHL